MGKRRAQYTQKYRSEWESDPALKDWIQPVLTDNTTAFCKYCRCILAAHYASLIEHKGRKKHTTAAEPFSSSRQQKLPPTFQPFVFQPEVAAAEAGMALFVTCHCAVRSVDHLCPLNKRLFSSAKGTEGIHLGRTKCTGVVTHIIGPHFKSSLVEDIGDGPYSLMIDESTDINVMKQLGVSINYISKKTGKLVSTFLTLQRIERGNAETIAAAVDKVLKNFELEPLKMIGLGTDNASVMTGEISGVYQRLKLNIPHLILIPCVCHSIQLAASAAVKETLPANLEFLVSETYSWFCRSSERQAMYRDLYNCLNDGKDPLKILKLHQVRWLSLYYASSRISNQWVELRQHFQLAASDGKCYTAQCLYDMYRDVKNELYLIFLKPILEQVDKTNKLFQTNNGDPLKLLESLSLMIKGIAKLVAAPNCRADFLSANLKDYIHPRPHLGYLFEDKMREARLAKPPLLGVDEEKIIRGKCIEFVIAMVTQLQRRLPDNVEVLQSVSLLSPANCLRAVKSSIIPLAQMMKEPRETISKIEFQWNKLSYVEWEEKEKSVPLWSEIQRYTDAAGENPLKELANFAQKCLVLPWSNGEVERAFSQMNVVKSPHRNKLRDTTLNAILTVRAGLRRMGLCCSSYIFPKDVLNLVGTNAAYKQADADKPENDNDGERIDNAAADIDDLVMALYPYEEIH